MHLTTSNRNLDEQYLNQKYNYYLLEKFESRQVIADGAKVKITNEFCFVALMLNC